MILEFIEVKTEAHSCVVELLQDLQERGFKFATAFLVLLDGSKGLHKGVRDVCVGRALIQRSQWHKRENVTSKITDQDFAEQIKKELEAACAWAGNPAWRYILLWNMNQKIAQEYSVCGGIEVSWFL